MKFRIVCVVLVLSALCAIPSAWCGDVENREALEKLRELKERDIKEQRALEEERNARAQIQDQRERAAKEREEVQRERNQRKAELEKQHAMESDRFHALQHELQDMSGRTDVSTDGLQKTAARLDDQLEAVQLEEISAKARSAALAQSIDELTKKAEEQAAKDPVLDELSMVVRYRTKAVERIKALVENRAVSAEEVDKANADLAEAKIRLLDRQHNVSAGGGEALAAWNKELVNLTVASFERQARQQALKERLERIRATVGRLPELQFQEEKMKSVRSKLVTSSYYNWTDTK